jgi:hypothetical protein
MYIGNTPAENYASFLTETFSVSATASYTLSHAVTNENDIRLVINGVVQQPGSGKAYTASGTTLTLTSATVSGDVMYAVYLGRALQTVNPPNASVGTAQLADDAVSSAKIASGVLPTNTPAFLVRLTGNQSISNNTDTILAFNREALDTDNAYNSTNYRFVPQVQGYYKIGVRITSQGIGNGQSLNIVKNGSTTVTEYQVNAAASTTNSQINEALVFMNGSSDYVDARTYQSSGSSKDYYGADYNCQFYGFRVIGV